jgi:hypothetical protein
VSWLLSLGIQLGWASLQLGHADVAVTARHYAGWCGGETYREPLRPEAGELPPDLLARVAESHQSPITSRADFVRDSDNASDSADFVVAQARVELATPAFSGRARTVIP